MIQKELLEILVCPETKQGLEAASGELLAELNGKIRGASLKNRGGREITEELTGALVRADRKFAYPIREDLPVMLIEEGIPLD